MNWLAKCLAVLVVAFMFSGCGDMMRSLRQESLAIDQDADGKDRTDDENTEQMAQAARPLRGVTANNVSKYDPPVRREYSRKLASAGDDVADEEGPEKRYKREDFVDSAAHENSLWDGSGQSNYLFTNNRRRETGDLITVDVERELKREIQYSLWMSLPPEQRRRPRKPASDDKPTAFAKAAEDNKTQTEKNKDAAEEAAKKDIASNGKEDDTVRMEVVEHLGNGLVRLVGNKRVIHKGVPNTVEVSALVNNKDIDDQNHLKSSSFLDLQTQVVQ